MFLFHLSLLPIASNCYVFSIISSFKTGSCQLLFTEESSKLLAALLQTSRIWRVHDVDQALRRINGMQRHDNDMAMMQWQSDFMMGWPVWLPVNLQAFSQWLLYIIIIGIFSSVHVFCKIVQTEMHLCPQSSCSNKGGLLPAHQCPIRSLALWCSDLKDASRKLATHGPGKHVQV